MHFKGILKGWILIFFCFFIVTAGCQKEVQARPTAPDFTLSDMSGQSVSLEQYKGRVVLLDFWATWCPPCRMTIPVLIKLQDQYRDNGLVILGVSIDDPKQITDKDMQHFIRMTKINYPVFRFNQKILEDYFSGQALSVPTMFIIDRNGKIRDKIVGFQPDALKKALAAAIK
ncbi:MAG: TlpA family protein disulfide reductase [Proteobacteria bacterium]|nr:TlpA family protein disulfide reductase [Pseudomonadota bacterium]MBU1903098.1 TlpA family protein disulfide reductase [Pseudomonadota bacterium]